MLHHIEQPVDVIELQREISILRWRVERMKRNGTSGFVLRDDFFEPYIVCRSNHFLKSSIYNRVRIIYVLRIDFEILYYISLFFLA